MSSCGLRQGRQRRANVIDDTLDKIAIVAFAHHPDERLGAGRPDDEATVLAEFLAAIFDHPRDTGVCERPFGLRSHIFQDLRHGFEAAAHVAYRFAAPALQSPTICKAATSPSPVVQ